MLEKMSNKTFTDIKDTLEFFLEEMGNLKKEFFDKHARQLFETFKNKYVNQIHNTLSDLENIVEDSNQLLESVKDSNEYKNLKTLCTELIFFLMREKRMGKPICSKLNILFQFLCSHLE